MYILRNFLYVLFLVAIQANPGWSQTNSNTYQNPVIPGFYPDPSLCRVGENYFLVTSTFEYFPGVPVFTSKDLIHWKKINHCLNRNSQLNLDQVPSSGGIYAPTIRFHEGTYYMVTTNVSHGGNFYVYTKNPYGDWSDPVYLDQSGIDPSFFFDDNGKVYLTTNGGNDDDPPGIYLSEIDIASGKILSDIELIWSGTGGRYPEGPHIYKKDGFYYLMISEGGTEYGHMITIARSQNINGPYEANPDNPILTHRDIKTQSHPVQGTGHGDLVQAHDGSWWMTFLGFRTVNQMFHHLGRETFLAPVSWNEAGWPVVNGDGTIQMEVTTQTLPLHEWPEKPATDQFENALLGLDWNFLRNPVLENWSLTERKGWLRLSGSPVGLDEIGSPTFIGKRQQHFNFEAITLLDFEPERPNEEAGLTAYMNENHHYKMYVTHSDSGRVLRLKYKVGEMDHLAKSVKIPAGPLRLKIEGTPTHYRFSYALPQQNTFLALGEMNTRYVSSEVAGGFTGVYLGLYATGNGQQSINPSDFDWFTYQATQPK
ncbi:MAG: glycoside hydrolase family 43 protein [Candidatus Cyclobacteriaceae bacterium M3_2C_046]